MNNKINIDLKVYEDLIRDRQTLEALYGDYPPKKFEGA